MKNYRIHLTILVLLLLFGLLRFCWREVPLDRIGVKWNQIGGMVKRDFPPGYVFVIPGLQRLEIMDPTIQDFTMASDVALRKKRGILSSVGWNEYQTLQFQEGQPITLRTQDEFTVDIDITVLYRIKPGRAHLVREQYGTGYKFQRILEQQARKVLVWEVLAKLSSPDFYNAEKRAAQAELAKEELNKALDQYQLEVSAVLIRNIEYQKELEDKLLALQLINQKKLLAQAEQRVEEAKEKTQMVEKATTAAVIAIDAELEKERKTLIAETDVKVAQLTADAEFDAQKTIAEAESYQRQQIALGELAKTTATAVGEQAVAAAYQGVGGDLYLAKQVLESIEFGDIEINTNQTNPFDVERMIQLIGLDLEAIRNAPATKP